MDEGLLGLLRLRDWLTHHPEVQQLVLRNTLPPHDDEAVYHSDGILLFPLAEHPGHYALVPAEAIDTVGVEGFWLGLGRLHLEIGDFTLPNTAMVSLLSETIDRFSGKGY